MANSDSSDSPSNVVIAAIEEGVGWPRCLKIPIWNLILPQ